MEHLWTWGGRYFGFRDGDALRTHTGRHVGNFNGKEVYGIDGRYLGEVEGDRLVVNRLKVTALIAPSIRLLPVATLGKFPNLPGFAMLAMYEDFPPPEAFG